jgi:hypothetical protein
LAAPDYAAVCSILIRSFGDLKRTTRDKSGKYTTIAGRLCFIFDAINERPDMKSEFGPYFVANKWDAVRHRASLQQALVKHIMSLKLADLDGENKKCAGYEDGEFKVNLETIGAALGELLNYGKADVDAYLLDMASAFPDVYLAAMCHYTSPSDKVLGGIRQILSQQNIPTARKFLAEALADKHAIDLDADVAESVFGREETADDQEDEQPGQDDTKDSLPMSFLENPLLDKIHLSNLKNKSTHDGIVDTLRDLCADEPADSVIEAFVTQALVTCASDDAMKAARDIAHQAFDQKQFAAVLGQQGADILAEVQIDNPAWADLTLRFFKASKSQDKTVKQQAKDQPKLTPKPANSFELLDDGDDADVEIDEEDE